MTFFWDTSALVRRYATHEPGAARVLSAMRAHAGHRQFISRLLPAEIASTLALKLRTRELDLARRDNTWRLFQADLVRQYHILELTMPVWRSAERLLFRHTLRAADAIHLAAALELKAGVAASEFVFWTADRQQARAADGEGLTVELLT